MENNYEYKYVAAINNPEEYKNNKMIKYVKYNTLFYLGIFTQICTSKVIINNSRINFPLFLSRNQFYIQTWHGSGAQKKCEKDVIDKIEKSYIKRAINESKKTALYIFIILNIDTIKNKLFKEYTYIILCCFPMKTLFILGGKKIKLMIQ